MDVSLLTIGNMLSQPDGLVQVGPRSNAPARDTRFSPAREHPQPPAEATRPSPPHHARAETPCEPASEERKDFKEVIDKQTRPGKPEEASDNRQPKRQDAESTTSDQAEPAQPVVAPNPAAVESNRKAASSATEPKASQQLAQLIKGAKTEKPGPNVAEIPKSPEIKLSATAQKKQPGSDTAAALAGQIRSEVKLSVADGTSAGTGVAAKSSDAKQLTPEASVVGDAKTPNTGKEHTIAADSLPAVDAKTPAANAATATDEISPDSGVQPPKMDESPAGQSAQTQQLSAPKTDQVVTGSDKTPNNTKEPLPTTEPEPDDTVQQTPTRPIGARGRNAGNPGNNTENPASEPAQVQTGTAQAETDGGSDAGGRSPADPAQILSQTPTQTAVTQQAPIFAVETAPTTTSEQPQTTSGDQLGSVGNQVLESVRSSLSQQTGDKEISIQLNPPELGKVSVKFQEQGGELTGTLEVSKAQTRTEIEQVLPEMIRSLADSGVAIKRLEVVLSQDEQSQQHGSRDPLLQDGAFQQRDSANSGQPGHEQQATQTYYGPTARYQYQNATNPYDMLVTNTSINMLV